MIVCCVDCDFLVLSLFDIWVFVVVFSLYGIMYIRDEVVIYIESVDVFSFGFGSSFDKMISSLND